MKVKFSTFSMAIAKCVAFTLATVMYLCQLESHVKNPCFTRFMFINPICIWDSQSKGDFQTVFGLFH